MSTPGSLEGSSIPLWAESFQHSWARQGFFLAPRDKVPFIRGVRPLDPCPPHPTLRLVRAAASSGHRALQSPFSLPAPCVFPRCASLQVGQPGGRMWSRPLGPTHTPLLCPDSLQDAGTSLRSVSCLLMAQNGARLASPREGRSCSPDGPCSARPPRPAFRASPLRVAARRPSPPAMGAPSSRARQPSAWWSDLFPKAPPILLALPQTLSLSPAPLSPRKTLHPCHYTLSPHPPSHTPFPILLEASTSFPSPTAAEGQQLKGSWGRGDGLPGGLADHLLRKLCRGVGVSLPERLEDEPHPGAAGTCVLI
ncbi:uncharacterized protein LOC125124809 isoform X1 [Phacochoerus africanus]|uniref:uncharacterized protein LOC125124809 isoform X1 n=1 Tax=Phacochoerus africanus TaxID=41426 RepID=UPI001FD906B1|nr:uncharacterized protein LOC125124809 isoform X1 [Phacochoerus africanus]XP_047630904.1 uncharacterized protein LOC125124809 isoform X1 [Phacochoerus africanus]XP_047630905.1 uncharacterized protein LOC125124809 isoform X1 [Phacochoerus africanus]